MWHRVLVVALAGAAASPAGFMIRPMENGRVGAAVGAAPHLSACAELEAAKAWFCKPGAER